jgi:hypothetical protein
MRLATHNGIIGGGNSLTSSALRRSGSSTLRARARATRRDNTPLIICWYDYSLLQVLLLLESVFFVLSV